MRIKRIIVGMLQTNCYLLFSEGEVAIVDPGADTKKIIKEIEKEGGGVKYIINTHSHPDHTFANKKVARETGAKILNDLKEGDKIEIGKSVLRVLHTPGHTKDSICLLGKGFLLSGDTLFSDGHGRTDLPGGSQEEMKESLERIRKEIPSDTVIYPGHGESFEK